MPSISIKGLCASANSLYFFLIWSNKFICLSVCLYATWFKYKYQAIKCSSLWMSSFLHETFVSFIKTWLSIHGQHIALSTVSRYLACYFKTNFI